MICNFENRRDFEGNKAKWTNHIKEWNKHNILKKSLALNQINK